jgi:hypothetical protein
MMTLVYVRELILLSSVLKLSISLFQLLETWLWLEYLCLSGSVFAAYSETRTRTLEHNLFK